MKTNQANTSVTNCTNKTVIFNFLLFKPEDCLDSCLIFLIDQAVYEKTSAITSAGEAYCMQWNKTFSRKKCSEFFSWKRTC